MLTFRLLLSLVPFAVFCLLLFTSRTLSLLKISFIALVLTIIIAIGYWQVTLGVILFSTIRGLLISLDIFVIVFGAILFLEITKILKIPENLGYFINKFSSDLRIQVIILAWFLENFIEGIAGFGTPAAVVAPILLALGLSPLKAIVISLLGNSISVPFGAAGTPLKIGLSGINLNPQLFAPTTALYNLIGFVVPVFMLWVLVSGQRHRKNLFLGALPFAIWSGVVFVVPAYFISLLGIEFPSIFGALIGVFIISITTKRGLFVPISSYVPKTTPSKFSQSLPLNRTIFPYFIFVLLLIFAKLILSSLVVRFSALDYTFNIFNPGTIFVFTSLIVALVYKISLPFISRSSTLAFKKSLSPYLVVALMSIVVQLMNNSDNPFLNLPSITQTISLVFNTTLLPGIAPFVGALGSFLTGSATVSNLMFAPSLYSSSLLMGLNAVKILALAMVGAGVGNMVALADVLAAKAVMDDSTSLRQLIKALLPYCLFCLVLVALIGLIF
ncbi:MAG: L-lactate permease [Candidatus Shapirobacteria bacterium]